MLKRLRSAHPMLYCLAAEVLFLGMLFVASLLSLLLILFVVRDIDAVDDYMLTFMQEAVGVLAAVYFRTGNIWVTVFIHAAMDITSMLIGGLYGTQTVADSISTYDITMLTSIAVYLIPTAFLLRKKKLSEVELYFGCDMK